MKRCLCLLLCLLLCFPIFCACRDEEPRDDASAPKNGEPVLGAQYTSAENTYNTHIRMRLVTQELTAPVSTITVEIQNDTDFRVNLLGKFESWECEKWENGVWTPIPNAVERENLYTDFVPPKSARSWTKAFAGSLDAGMYRLQRTVEAAPDASLSHFDEKAFSCMIELYFTVV